MNVLLDENISPFLAQWLHQKNVPAQAVAHVGLGQADDPTVWTHAFDHDQVVVTLNAGDFLTLAAGVELHPGLLVLRIPGLSRAEQWRHIEPAIDFCLGEEAAGRSMVNRVVEIHGHGHGQLTVYDLPVV